MSKCGLSHGTNVLNGNGEATVEYGPGLAGKYQCLGCT